MTKKRTKLYEVCVLTKIMVAVKDRKELDQFVETLQEPCYYDRGKSFGSRVEYVNPLPVDVAALKFPKDERPTNIAKRAKEYFGGDRAAVVAFDLGI